MNTSFSLVNSEGTMKKVSQKQERFFFFVLSKLFQMENGFDDLMMNFFKSSC